MDYKQKLREKKSVKAAIGISLMLVLFILAAVMIPTIPYYLKYNHLFYMGKDYSQAEYAANIPYDDYIFDMRVEDARRYASMATEYYASDYNQNVSDSLQAAIDIAAGKGGGIVVADESITVKSIKLKSDICLFIPKGITITVDGYRTQNNSFRFIQADGAENVTITGGGKIRGDGKAYWRTPSLAVISEPFDEFNINLLEYIHFGQKYTRKEDISTKFIVFNNCENVTVTNLIIEDSPGWNLSVEASSNVKIANLVLDSNYHGANTDGIDICGTSNVLIESCYLSVGDDAICLKNNKAYNDLEIYEMKNIEAKNCFIRSATNGFKIGTEVYHDITDVRVSDLIMEVQGLYPPTICGITLVVTDGGKLSDVSIDNVTMNNVLAPLFIRLSNRNRFEDKPMSGIIKNVSFKNIKATNTELPILIAGVADEGKVNYIDGVILEDINVSYREVKQARNVNKATNENVNEAAKDYPEVWMMGNVPAYGVYIRNAKNVTMNRCEFKPRSEDERAEVVRYFIE